MTNDSPIKKTSILLVDDEPGLLMTLGLLMESAGFQVLAASNGVDALAVLEDSKPDLIVTDFMMPRMDGLGLIAEIRKQQSLVDIPIIFTSAVDVSVPDHPGADITFLHKPVSWTEMKARIAQLLSGQS